MSGQGNHIGSVQPFANVSVRPCGPPFTEVVEKGRIRCQRSFAGHLRPCENTAAEWPHFKSGPVRYRPLNGRKRLPKADSYRNQRPAARAQPRTRDVRVERRAAGTRRERAECLHWAFGRLRLWSSENESAGRQRRQKDCG